MDNISDRVARFEAAIAEQLASEVKANRLYGIRATEIQIAEAAGMSAGSLRRYMKNERSISTKDLTAVLLLLGTDPAEFVSRAMRQSES